MIGVVGSGFSNGTGPAMDVQIFVETTFDDGSTQRREIARLDRTPDNSATETLGLRLDEAKNFLTRLQEVLLCNQIDEVLAASRICDDCGKRRAIHDDRGRTLDTLYGRFRVKALRLGSGQNMGVMLPVCCLRRSVDHQGRRPL